LAQELYKILIAGMADDLRQADAKTLMWSLDGALRYIPLAALYDGKHYLVEQYGVSVMTLASNTRLKDRPGRLRNHSGPPVGCIGIGGHYFDEARRRRVLAGEIKLDAQFTQQSMRETLLKHYPVVHIASHFNFQAGNETKSYLLLGDGGHLSLAQLKTSANLFGGVQLLTLSACNTGVGDGAEVEGFGALAQRQGAKAVVASLWPVVDASTALLMRELYRIREANPSLTKLEALRQAQIELLQGKITSPSEGRRRALIHETAAPSPSAQDFRHPYFWAPFFLMGNWL
jgi:CHAT domain-containing protein